MFLSIYFVGVLASLYAMYLGNKTKDKDIYTPFAMGLFISLGSWFTLFIFTFTAISQGVIKLRFLDTIKAKGVIKLRFLYTIKDKFENKNQYNDSNSVK